MPEPDELDEVGDVLKLLLQQDNFEATEFGISDLPVDEADKINENNGYDRDNKDKQPNETITLPNCFGVKLQFFFNNHSLFVVLVFILFSLTY